MKQLSFSKQFWKQLNPVGNFLAVGSPAHMGHYFDFLSVECQNRPKYRKSSVEGDKKCWCGIRFGGFVLFWIIYTGWLVAGSCFTESRPKLTPPWGALPDFNDPVKSKPAFWVTKCVIMTLRFLVQVFKYSNFTDHHKNLRASQHPHALLPFLVISSSGFPITR